MESTKRQYSHEHEGDQNSKRKREDTFSSSIIIGNTGLGLDIKNDIMPYLAPMISRWVREEVESKLLRKTINQTGGASEAKFLKLVFKNDLADKIFTLSEIKAKDNKPVEIALYDVRSGSIVTHGPLSSIEIKICVLNSEFCGSNGSSSNHEEWTTEEFKTKILRPRENKGQLLKGDTVMRLENGVCCITKKTMFTDNSSWTRSGRFNLGAMVQSTSTEARSIKEAISNRFRVKECRVNLKHYPPSLNDEIWRLEGISRDGETRKRLCELGIKTVNDLLLTDRSSLLKKCKNISRKLREAIEHAKTCNKEEAPLANLQVPLDLPAAQQDLTYGADEVGRRQDFGQPPSASTTSLLIGEAAHNNQLGFSQVFSGNYMEQFSGGVNYAHDGFLDIPFENM